MKLRFLAVVAVVAAFTCTITAHAQVGLYLNPVATRISNSVGDTGPYAFLGQNSKSQMFYGVDFGGYYDFFHGTKLNAGFDMRDSIVHGNNAMLNSFLVGVRVSGKPFDRPSSRTCKAQSAPARPAPPQAAQRPPVHNTASSQASIIPSQNM